MELNFGVRQFSSYQVSKIYKSCNCSALACSSKSGKLWSTLSTILCGGIICSFIHMVLKTLCLTLQSENFLFIADVFLDLTPVQSVVPFSFTYFCELFVMNLFLYLAQQFDMLSARHAVEYFQMFYFIFYMISQWGRRNCKFVAWKVQMGSWFPVPQQVWV